MNDDHTPLPPSEAGPNAATLIYSDPPTVTFIRPHSIDCNNPPDRYMTGNLAIFDPDAPARILAAAQDETDWGIAWCLLKEGMHPTQIVRLSGKNLHGDWLTWKRVKNERPREAFVPKADQERLLAFLENHKPTRKTMWLRVIAMSRRAGYDATPRELRKTAILGWIREYRGRQDMMALVAARAGCSQDTVARYYLSLTQWETAGSPSERRRNKEV